jgi:UrcA family protein
LGRSGNRAEKAPRDDQSSSRNGLIGRKESTMNTITSTSLHTLVAGAILSALALSFATVSRADDGMAPPQVIVKFADLDVSTSQGAVALYGRIHSAAVDVCSRMYYSTEAYRRHKDACLQKLIADAVTKINEPALSAVFASKFGVAPPMVLAAAGTH